MAWISVHDTIDNQKLREFHKLLGCSKFEAVGILNFLWLWGLTNATKTGLIPAADEEDIERYLYGKGNGTEIPCQDIVKALLEAEYLERREDGLYIHDWDEWQKEWYRYLERRENDVKRKRRKKELLKGKIPQSTEKNAETPQKIPEKADGNADGKVPAKKRKEYSKDFEKFWEAYPNTKGKAEANKCYAARLKEGWSPEELYEAACNYAAECRKRRTEQQYIKHGSTFLSANTPFVDYLPGGLIPKGQSDKNSQPDMSNPF